MPCTRRTTAEFLDAFVQAARRASRDEAFADASALAGVGRVAPAKRRAELEARDDGIARRQRRGLRRRSGSRRVGHARRQVASTACLRLRLPRSRHARPGAGPPDRDLLGCTGAGDDFELHICESTRSDRGASWSVPGRGRPRVRLSPGAVAWSWVVRVGDLDEVHRVRAPRTMLDDDGPPMLSIQVSGPLDTGAVRLACLLPALGVADSVVRRRFSTDTALAPADRSTIRCSIRHGAPPPANRSTIRCSIRHGRAAPANRSTIRHDGFRRRWAAARATACPHGVCGHLAEQRRRIAPSPG